MTGPSHRQYANRPAFTLLEILLALGLSTVVVAASFQAVRLSWLYRSAGETSVVASQVRRGIVADISYDLRSLDTLADDANTPVATLTAPTTSLDLNTTWTPAEQVRERFLHVDELEQAEPILFYGDSNVVVLYAASENSRFSRLQAGTSRRHVVWLCRSSDTANAAFSSRSGVPIIQPMGVDFDSPGLYRVERSHHTDTFRGTRKQHSSRLIAEAFTAVAFRYFDGREWRTRWNSSHTSSLPRAVEVTLSDEGDRDDLRFVVAIPNADRSAPASGRAL